MHGPTNITTIVAAQIIIDKWRVYLIYLCAWTKYGYTQILV